MKRKKYVALLTMLAMVVCTMFCTNTVKADTETSWDESDVLKFSKCTVNGSERTLTLLKNGDLYFEIKETGYSELIYLNVTDAGFDKDCGTIYCVESGMLLGWWNYDLTHSPVINSVFKDMNNPEDPIGNIEKLLFTENGEFVIGYKTISGETYPTLTMSEMKAFLKIPDTPPSPTTVQTPTPTNTDKPVATQKPTVSPQPTVAPKVSLKKQSGYTCLSVGNKVVSKYKLKKGVLTWKGTKKSIKVKQVKQVGYIEKSQNLIYMTKKGRVYTISQKGKKKTILKKGAKKLIFKNDYVSRIKKKSGYMNVVNK